MNSIISNEPKCFLCGSTRNLHKHHLYLSANRKISEDYGLWVYLCQHHHTGDINGNQNAVHFNKELMQILHEVGQTAFEREHSREEFISLIGRSYK